MLFGEDPGDSSVSSITHSYPQGKHWASHYENLFENFTLLYSDTGCCCKLTTANQYHQTAIPRCLPEGSAINDRLELVSSA